MPEPLLLLQDDSQLTVAWAEFITRTGLSPASVTMSWNKGTQAVITIDVNFSDVNDNLTTGVFQQILGYSVRVPPPVGSPTNTPGTISRIPPIAHPFLPQLWATRISKCDFYGPAGKMPALRNGALYGLGPFASWRTARITILFEALDYIILNDNQLAQYGAGTEANRYVSGPYAEYNLQGLQRQAGRDTGLQWVTGPTVGQHINFGVVQMRPIVDYVLTWRQVPEKSLFNSAGVAANVELPYGCTNIDTFLGHPNGTLLFMKPRIEPVPSPFTLTGFTTPQRLWDVTYRLSYLATGWNNLPHPQGGYYYAVFPNGSTLYNTVTFGDYLFVSL